MIISWCHFFAKWWFGKGNGFRCFFLLLGVMATSSRKTTFTQDWRAMFFPTNSCQVVMSWTPNVSNLGLWNCKKQVIDVYLYELFQDSWVLSDSCYDHSDDFIDSWTRFWSRDSPRPMMAIRWSCTSWWARTLKMPRKKMSCKMDLFVVEILVSFNILGFKNHQKS